MADSSKLVRIVTSDMEDCKAKLDSSKKNYEEAGKNLIAAFDSAIADMQGASKDALEEFFNTKIKNFVTTDIPSSIDGLSNMLASNLKNFNDVDAKIAQSIRGNNGNNGNT